ncbi:MAG: trypsin-like peptidase domain-containing protein [Clostridium sp.]|jgi:serine protease Do|uniref:S1C family serine protease n=1 Tax=Clostridium sp. TaxID=1506 RepID=UPI0025BEAB84|nr:trypsin-like peptidase domain-containing protein [Clostridium sp.]MCH3964662.1 trypsin-like peptidase domain-containing protein [Clostridium sp.]MCI1715133.1 trypsin-like peptidase domain-containing protein [Clostridium sp.]MCI1799395.1 trypsin-like peptidase domain-containing protein [Clostridium sp.]MCI1813316.1 trypsin-like peptidase domain-containing protein [Clostridium sp.]MCI1870207.1 trypsin-like peptidase domain-containing protein [Clostridium sp.]
MENFKKEKENSFKHRFKFKGGRLLSYIAVAVVASLIGGSISAAAFLYILPNTDFFKNTPLYESVANSVKIPQSQVSNVSTNSSSNKSSGLSVAEIAKRVSPAVVGVSVKTISQGSYFGFSGNGGMQEEDGMGSGIIINSDGYILTNYHVVQGAQTVSVILNNKKEVPAKVVNYNANQDLAVIKVTTKVAMPAVAELGDSSKLQVGDPVVAIGNPLGKELLGSVTSGIISATNREISVGDTSQSFLQTDAAINPGNSGGALVNSLGQVVGVNSAKIGGDVEGIGFSIPINTVKSKLSGLLKPSLKIGIACIDSDQGVYIAEVERSSPAEKAGLQVDDIIQKFDGKKVTSVNEINEIKAKHKSGDTVSIVVSRDGKIKTLNLTLVESE